MPMKPNFSVGRSTVTKRQRLFLEEIAAGRNPLETQTSHHQNEVVIQGLISSGRVIWDDEYKLTAKGRLALNK